MPKKGRHPQLWISGPDPVDHMLYEQCQKARAQAWYRGEQWLITEQEYIALWRKDNRYLNRGRHCENLCMTRLDTDLPWQIDNVKIITRLEHYKNCKNLQGGDTTRNKVYAEQ